MLTIIAETADIAGKVLVSYTALAVHYRVRHERSIDDRVFRVMRRENTLGVLGISLMVVSYILHLFAL